MSGLCVIGLQWGDEAKGKLVDLLTEGHDIVVRYQGGANAGHTVVVGDETYKLHLIPSGIINKSVTNIVASGVVMDPGVILGEIEMLRSRGLEVQGRLLLSDRAHVVFPWHVAEDQMWNQIFKGDDNIGTTLRGIGPCYRDKVGRSFALRLGDLIRDNLPQRIAEITRQKLLTLNAMSAEKNLANKIELDSDSIVKQYTEFGNQLKPYITDTTALLLDAIEANKKILFEGAQGALLDIDHGTFPFVTSSNSSGAGITAGSGVPVHAISKVIGVLKCYSTRVGGGPFPTEQDNDAGEHIRKRGNEYGTTTGRPRRCGWFDAVAARYSARLSGANTLALTMMDVLSDMDEIQVCIAYELEGKRISDFPSNSDDLTKAKPVFETLAGWNVDVTEIRNQEDLPANALRYVERISQLVERPVEFISVGPDRNQTIFCGNRDFVASS